MIVHAQLEMLRLEVPEVQRVEFVATSGAMHAVVDTNFQFNTHDPAERARIDRLANDITRLLRADTPALKLVTIRGIQ